MCIYLKKIHPAAYPQGIAYTGGEGRGGGFKEKKREAFGKAETIQPCLLIDWPLRLMNISIAFQLEPLEASPVA
jgi:hypothetical protein